MRKSFSIIIALGILYSCNLAFNSNLIKSQKIDFRNEIKRMIIGKWVATTNNNVKVEIKDDTIKYYYGEKILEKKFIEIKINDSALFFRTKDGAYNFLQNGKLYPMVKILKFDKKDKPIENIVIYIDKLGLSIITENKDINLIKVN